MQETKRRFNLPALFALCLLLLFSSTACSPESDDNDDPPGYSDYVERGKRMLGEGNGVKAAAAFESAYAIDPNGADAKYGIVISATMAFANIVDQVAGTIEALSFTEGTGGQNKSAYTIEPTVGSGNQIHLYLLDKIAPYVDRAEQMYWELSEEPDFYFELDDYTLTVLNSELAHFSGAFHKTDLHFFGAINALIDGAVKFLLAYDLKFDYTKLVLPEIPEDAALVDTLGPYVEMIQSLLVNEKFPDFLLIESEYGASNLPKSGIGLGNFFYRFYTMYQCLREETGDQTGHPIRYFDQNRDGRFDPYQDIVLIGSNYTFRSYVTVSIEQLFFDMTAVFWEGSELDMNPDAIDYFTPSQLTMLLTALDVLPIKIGPIVLDSLPAFPKINIGQFFSEPETDGLKSLLITLTNLWDLIADHL